MALIDCPECGKGVSSQAAACPDCGHPISLREPLRAPAKNQRRTYGCGTLLVVLFVLYALGTALDKTSGRGDKGPGRAVPPVVNLTPAEKAARVEVLLAELKKLPASEYEKNYVRYVELQRLVPGEAVYAQKAAFYRAKIDRKKKIESMFNQWSGAHMRVERLVKKNLLDPDSYEHIETRYIDKGETITVYTKYRAHNAFGGYAISDTLAECTVEGACTILQM